MSRTFRNIPKMHYATDHRGEPETRRDGIRIEKHLKRLDGYSGWADEGMWNRKAKAANKRCVSRHNRRIANIDANVDAWE